MPESLEKILLTKIVLLCLAIGCDKHCQGSDWNPWPSAYESSPARPAAVASNTVAATPPLSAAPVQNQFPGVGNMPFYSAPAGCKALPIQPGERNERGELILARWEGTTTRQAPPASAMRMEEPTGGFLQPCLQNYSYAAGYSTPMSYSGCGPGGCR